jgi:enoyl-CoA hydratase/carnithine racemase
MIHSEETEPGIWQVQLQSPERRNALNEEAYTVFAETLKTIDGIHAARCIVLSSQGPVFCAGNDLAEFETRWPQPERGPVYRFLETVAGLDVPVIAAVQGAAVGVGATMLLHCDVVVAAPAAFLQFPFVDIGITMEGGSSHLLPRLLGHARAMDILLTARRVHADEAYALGLVSRISRDEPPRKAALTIARAIAAKPKPAVAATKRLARASLSGVLPARFEEELQVINGLIRDARAAKKKQA